MRQGGPNNIFEKLKAAITILLVLEVLDFSQYFVVETDPSIQGLGLSARRKTKKHFGVDHYHKSQWGQNKLVYEKRIDVNSLCL